jgi:serpin B
MKKSTSDNNDLLHQINDWLDDDLNPDDQKSLVTQIENDPNSRRDFLENLHLDTAARSLLENPIPQIAPAKKTSWLKPAAFVAACLTLGLAIWKFTPSTTVPTPPIASLPALINLDSGWQITRTGDALFEILNDGRISLTRGEILVESTRLTSSPLRVETPTGEATAEGTKFFIAHHQPKPNQPMKPNQMNSTTRVLVLSGLVTLTNNLGTISAQAGEIAEASKEQAPLKEVVQANSSFAIEMYRTLASGQDGENLFFSPYSVSSSLAMLSEAARGEAALEIGHALHLPDSAKRIGDDAQLIPWNTTLLQTGLAGLNQRFMATNDPARIAKNKAELARLIALEKKHRQDYRKAAMEVNNGGGDEALAQRKAALKTLNDTEYALWQAKQGSQPYEINIANGIWSDTSLPPSKDYLATLKNFYGAQASSVDFQKNPDKERESINKWVSDQTNGRIADLFAPGTINSDTSAVMANAIYFKGTWRTVFDEASTRPMDFRLTDGSTSKVDMMHLSEKNFRIAELRPNGTVNKPIEINPVERRWPDNPDGMKLIELPYKGDGISMVVILPNKADGLPALEQRLSHDNLKAWISKLKYDEVNLDLPKFKMETSCDLASTYAKLGIKKAFQPGGLSGFSDAPEAKDFFLGAAIHKGFIEVNERGTEAAAASGHTMELSIKPNPATFKADHPFLFLIRDQKTESILFLGRLTTPAE